MTTTFNDKVDSAFGVAIVLLFLVCIFLLLFKGIFAADDMDALNKGVNSAIGGGGATGAAMLYMKWRVIREAKLSKLKPEDAVELLKKQKDEQEG